MAQDLMVYRADRLVAEDIDSYLAQHLQKDMLRFITCGSVDDGKSTLIGRLLYECQSIFEDQLAALERESKTHGTQGQNIDFALLVDGLAAEREQGITIDVAYRYFTTQKRKFIVADTPGHEQYTRNMVTGASTADAAVILIDARKGLLTQSRRHSLLVHLLGIKHVILAVNKMDLVGFDPDRFDEIVTQYQIFALELGLTNITAIPVSGLTGDNIVRRSEAMSWYKGPTLLAHLETLPVGETGDAGPLRFPVQWVNRPNADFRGFAGQIASGSVKVGDGLRVLPSGKTTRLREIVTYDGPLESAVAGQSVCLTFEDEVDCSRGDVIVTEDAPLEVADQFEATLVWMSQKDMLPGRNYLLQLASQTVVARFGPPKYEINVNTGAKLAAKTLALNAIGAVPISCSKPLIFAPYAEDRTMGSFVVIDRSTHETVGAGMIRYSLRRAQNIHWQALEVDGAAHARQKEQEPKLIWFTGLSGAGKSTIANLVEKKLYALGKHSYLLDGDNIRHGLSRDLGFTDADRVENIRRVGEVSKLMLDAGLIVLTAFISPFRAERQMVRELIAQDQFVEVFVDAPLDLVESRDVKGLYRKARSGGLKNFTGIDSPYEDPLAPDIHIRSDQESAEEAADRILAYIFKSS